MDEATDEHEPVAPAPVDDPAPSADPSHPAAPTDEMGSAQTVAASEASPRAVRMQFTGTGAEYFRIWIVNLLLTIVTVGIYSAWAKVRKMQYLYRNTHLDGSGFDYHGNPIAILKGRLLAVLVLVLYNLSSATLGAFALIAPVALVAVFPWLLAQSYRFRLHNSSYRGLRFRFAGPVLQAYLIFGLPALLLLIASAPIASAGHAASHSNLQNPGPFIGLGAAYLVLALIWPYLHFCFKRWQHANALYGTGHASFLAKPGSFYGVYLLASVMLIVAFVLFGLLMGGVAAIFHPQKPAVAAGMMVAMMVLGISLYGAVLALGQFVIARIQNVVWSGTRLEGVGFESDIRASRLIGITLGNLVMVIFSVGMLIPFALIRLMKYKIESIRVLDADALTRFAGEGAGAQVGTAGEGAVDVLDLDFGL